MSPHHFFVYACCLGHRFAALGSSPLWCKGIGCWIYGGLAVNPLAALKAFVVSEFTFRQLYNASLGLHWRSCLFQLSLLVIGMDPWQPFGICCSSGSLIGPPRISPLHAEAQISLAIRKVQPWFAVISLGSWGTAPTLLASTSDEVSFGLERPMLPETTTLLTSIRTFIFLILNFNTSPLLVKL